MITDPNIYFKDGCGRCKKFQTPECKVHKWAEGLAFLRKVCLDLGLEETAKWGHPCYTLNGGNIVMVGAFKEDFHLSFFKASLMKDSGGLFTKRGENTQVASVVQFYENDQPSKMKETVVSYISEAIDIEKSGKKVKREAAKFEVPQELVDAMDSDPELAEAFEALTPGRQRAHSMLIGGAKQAATRINRIAKYRDKILNGKGPNE